MFCASTEPPCRRALLRAPLTCCAAANSSLPQRWIPPPVRFCGGPSRTVVNRTGRAGDAKTDRRQPRKRPFYVILGHQPQVRVPAPTLATPAPHPVACPCPLRVSLQ